MKSLKDLKKLIDRHAKLFGETSQMIFVDAEGNQHPLGEVRHSGDLVSISFGKDGDGVCEVSEDDLSSIEFNSDMVEGMDIEGIPFKVLFEEYGAELHQDDVDESLVGEDDEDSMAKALDDPMDDGIDDDHNIRTSDDY